MTIQQLRHRIDSIDRDLVLLLVARVNYVIEIQKLKRRKGLDIEDQKRESEILKKLLDGKTEVERAYIETAFNSLFNVGRKL